MEIKSIEEFTKEIEALKHAGNYVAARNILEQTVAWLESHSDPEQKMPPWYFDQLSIVLKKLGEPEEAERRRIQAEEIVLQNYIIHCKQVMDMPKPVRDQCYPNGPVPTKKELEAAKRLLKSRPELIKISGLLKS
jgi:hypothetical protein